MLNHRNNKEYNLYDATEIGAYGQKVFSNMPITTLSLNIMESNYVEATGEPRAADSDAFCITWYVHCKPGQILESTDSKYQIVRAINSTRFAQLYLKKI